MSDDARPGAAEMEWMRKWLVVPGGPDYGKPFELLPHEEKFLGELFRPGVRLGILSTPRKNRKTTLCAAIVLCYLCGPRSKVFSELVSTALSLDQAARIYQEAVRLQSPELAILIHPTPSRKALYYEPLKSSYTALSADVKTKLGGGARLAIHDELGEVSGPISSLYNAVETGMVAHDDALSVVISTQAEADEDLLSIMIDDQLEDPRDDVVLQLHQGPEGCDVHDRDAWAIANPALDVIVKTRSLIAAADKTDRSPEFKGTFRRYHLNQRVPAGESGELKWLSTDERREQWAACDGEPDELPEGFDGAELFGGIDLSETRDLTCICWAWRPEVDGAIHLKVRTWIPGYRLSKRSKEERVPWATWADMGLVEVCPGKVVDLEDIAEAVVEAEAVCNLVSLRYDRWRFAHLLRILEPVLGEAWIEDHTDAMGQGYASMSPALGDFDEQLAAEALRHGGHPVLRMGAQQARVARDPGGNRKLTRKNPRHKIDGLVAAVMAVAALLAGDSGTLDVPDDGLVIMGAR